MLTYTLTKDGSAPLYRKLYTLIKNDIASGSIKPGEKLPSKRAFSDHLGVSIMTVEQAYRLLIDEGYVYSKDRSGRYVCDIGSILIPSAESSTPGERSVDYSDLDIKIDFPFATLSKIIRKTLGEYGEKLLLKPPHNGCKELRDAISDFLLRYRGMTAPPEQIIIGSGAEYLYGMIVQLLGRDIIYGLEDPSYEKIKSVYLASGAQCQMLPMDETGVSTRALNTTSAGAIHVTPYHSYPTGITAPASKRFQYLAWAKRTGGIIIEDDFASELAVNVKPVETIFSMDKSDSVIYLNTFSKSLAPSMRMGYMVLPKALAALYEEKLGFYSCTVPVIDQYVLAQFISGGHFERHLNRMRRSLKRMNSEKEK